MDEKAIIYDYVHEKMNIYEICYKYKIGKIRFKEILKQNNIELRKRGGQKLDTSKNVLSDYSIKKYEECDGYHYIAVDKNSGEVFNDYMNYGGFLTSHINKVYNIEIPPIYARRKYYMETGNYWWEQWFDIIKIKDLELKKCPYCDWSTTDTLNKSGAFEVHLRKCHGITKQEYLEEYPNDKEYFFVKNPTLFLQLETDEDNYVVCQICGKKLKRVDNTHLKKHGITKEEYVLKYGTNTVCKNLHDKLKDSAINLNSKYIFKTFESKSEKEIKAFINDELGIKCEKNRSILNGKELDIYIPSHRLAIEFNGNLWHSENFGKKDKTYHLSKTEICESVGVNLIQIFEDEFTFKKDVLFKYLSSILKQREILDYEIECKEISYDDAKTFFNENSIIDFKNARTYIGGYYNDKLYGIMSFNENELCQIAFDLEYKVKDIEKKIFEFYINQFGVNYLFYNADRRFLINNELLNDLGFRFCEKCEPSYYLFNPSIHRIKRYNIGEIDAELSDRIWDCGLLKYIWFKP